MGGYGSGRRIRKTSTGDCISLNIKQVKDILKYPNNTIATVTWHNNNEVSLLKVDEHTLRLNYTYSIKGKRRTHDCAIGIDFTDCYYGGKRAWFKCPKCNKMVAGLWLKSGMFYCRGCHNLNYFSSRISGDYTEIYNRKIRKLQDKLQTEHDVLASYAPLPKGMHYITYYKLLDELYSLQEIKDIHYIELCKRRGISY